MKIRLDQYLVQHGMIQSRERAKALIMSGIVFVDEQNHISRVTSYEKHGQLS